MLKAKIDFLDVYRGEVTVPIGNLAFNDGGSIDVERDLVKGDPISLHNDNGCTCRGTVQDFDAETAILDVHWPYSQT